jgi:hypothetical protein
MNRPNPSIVSILDGIEEVLQTGTPVNAVASQGVLTIAVQPTAGDTMTIGTKVYTFVADGTEAEEGDISVETDLATAKVSIVAAINGTDSINTSNADVVASNFSTNDCTLTAKVKGVIGDTIVTTETFTAETNIFDAGTLGTETAGLDGTVGKKQDTYLDNSYLYVAIADNTTADANWRRIALGSAY